MKTKAMKRYGTVGLLLLASGAWVGCESDDTTVVPSGDTSSSSSSSGTGGSIGTGGEGGSGPVEGTPQSCEAWGGVSADPAYPGVDVARFAGQPVPAGCDRGLVGSAITLETGSAPLAITFADGKLVANGVTCTDATGAPVEVEAALRITVRGTADADALLLDVLGASALATGALVVDLAGGDDVVFLRGTDQPDAMIARGSQADAVFDLDGNGGEDTRLRGVEQIVVALGPGDDHFDAMPDEQPPVTAQLTVCAGGGADTLRAGASKDRLEGGADDDVLIAGANDDSDMFDGGAGNDVMDYAARTDHLAISLDDKANDGAAEEKDHVVAVETILGGSGDDTIRGSAAAEHLVGGPGDDTLDGGFGDDVLDGDDGNDRFVSGGALDGADVMNGGEGVDIASYVQRGSGIHATTCIAAALRGCAVDSCACAANDGEDGEADTLVNVEGVEGTDLADVMIGDDGDNVFFGNGGDDTLDGGKGNDSVFGDDGADTIIGAEGDDYLDGGLAFDIFEGGDGSGDICIVDPTEIATRCELF